MKPQVWSLILTFSLSVSAITGDPSLCAGCRPKLSGQPNGSELNAIKKIASHQKSDPIKVLSASICAIYSGSAVNLVKNVKASIKKHMKRFEGNNNPTGAQMLQFLNKNRHKMTCEDKNGIEKNYMKYAFDRSAYSALFDELFYEDLMEDDAAPAINVNAVSYTADGKPETVLDYMDSIIKDNTYGDASTEEIIELRNLFSKDLGAKKFKDLSLAEQAKHKGP